MGVIDPTQSGALRVDAEVARRAAATGCWGCVVDGGGAVLWESPPGWLRPSGLRPMSAEVIEYLRTDSVAGSRVRVSGAAEERGLKVILDLEPCVVLGEPEAMIRLFANLAENAVRYARAPGTVTFRCAREGSAVIAAVEDTGPEVPPHERPDLFRRFFRGERGRAADGQGSGLGLSIADAAARLHGARIAYEAIDTGGNRFAVRFPTRA